MTKKSQQKRENPQVPSDLTREAAPESMLKIDGGLPLYKGHHFWAIGDVIYGLGVFVLSYFMIPKSNLVISTLCLYGLSVALGGGILLIGTSLSLKRLGWRMSVITALIGICLGGLFGGLCLGSGLYWLGVYGVLGWGVFISSALLFSGILQLLILYPALKLRRLMSAEVRSFFGEGGWAKLALYVTLTPPIILALLGLYTGHMSAHSPLDHDHRSAVTQYLRLTLEGRGVQTRQGVVDQPLPASTHREERESKEAILKTLRGVPLGAGNLIVSLYAGGKRLARVSGRGFDLASATRNAAVSLKSHHKLSRRRLLGGRLVVDRVIGIQPLYGVDLPMIGAPLLALSLDPGVDGIQSAVGGHVRTLIPSDLIERQVFGVVPLVPGVPEMRLGADVEALFKIVGRRGLRRIRTEQWVEPYELSGPSDPRLGLDVPPPLVTLRSNVIFSMSETSEGGLPPHSSLTSRRSAYIEAAHRSGRYLVRHLDDDGRFHYQYFPYEDRVYQPKRGYSIPRHAGAIYGLSLLYEDRPLEIYQRAATKAIRWLKSNEVIACGGWSPEVSCLSDHPRGYASLGQSALSAIALLSYVKNTGDTGPLSFAEGLIHFLLKMQRPDGEFHQLYSTTDDSIFTDKRGMFASEQAAFALVLAAQMWPKGPWLDAAKRALDALTVKKYSGDFLSQFFYGADHWTCLAADAAYPQIKHPRYLEFCLGYSRFLQRLQYRSRSGEGDPSWDGHYGFGFFSPPQAPATGGFGEGVMATLSLAKSHGRDPSTLSDLYHQALAGSEALSRDQIQERNHWPFPNQENANGAIRRSLVESEVRVDFVQHALSALLMWRKL